MADEIKIKGMNLSMEARLALDMISRWGMSAAEPNGVDDAGRQKLRPLSPADIVDRAAAIAERTVREFMMRGWITPVIEDGSGED